MLENTEGSMELVRITRLSADLHLVKVLFICFLILMFILSFHYKKYTEEHNKILTAMQNVDSVWGSKLYLFKEGKLTIGKLKSSAVPFYHS